MNNSSNDYDGLMAYRFCQSSGVLDFWDNPEEDIYSFEDGEPIDEEEN
jgi:hypothetical protein